MWQPFMPVLLLLLHMKGYMSMTDCTWVAVVNDFEHLGGDRNIFFKQHKILEVTQVFQELVDSAIDPKDKDAKYLGFPYYLKINLTCRNLNSAVTLRTAHYSGLRPIVTVTFQEPVHSVRQKQEQLQIKMLAAPFRFPGCESEVVCRMAWYTPMPFMNGSVVMNVLVESNGLGLPMESKRFSININGYAEAIQNAVVFTIGEKLKTLKDFVSLRDPSRPLWHTHQRAPVLILGGVPENKIVFLSDTEFEDFFAIEVGIDSCWIGSLSCPQKAFSSSISDTIATESTLFIRQNQLVYYFTGHYPILYMNSSGSELWTRILNNVCVKKLNPVFFAKNDTEYVIALGGGWQDGHFFLLTVRDGIVKASGSLKTDKDTVCTFMKFEKCSILWALFSTNENKFYLLVHDTKTDNHSIVAYYQAEKYFEKVYAIPTHVPKASDKGFVMLLGLEHYTNTALTPRGLALNPSSKMFYVWGNVILQSNDMVSYIYLSNFPSNSPIKYFVLSFTGRIAFVTDQEEVWLSNESGTDIFKVYPSQAWNVYNTLQVMEGAPNYGSNLKHSIVSIFFDANGMQELVYIEESVGKGRVVKRKFPLNYILTYDQLISTPHKEVTVDGQNYIRFTHRCPFAVHRLVDLPLTQRFSRMEHYRANPPEIMEKTGFHDKRSLTVYQGLIYQLLQLHSSYHRSYADPVHDPTWRWWKNKKQDAEYYSYMASNWKSSGGMYVDMANYVKIYNLKPNNMLPESIYLDKKTAFTFNVYLSIRTSKQSIGETADENSLHYIWLTAILSHPEYVHADLDRQELISRGSVLYRVTISDIGIYPRQQLSGKNLLKSSVNFKIAHSGMSCYEYTGQGPRLKGNSMVQINIGCPPGKRLAFDITYTKNYTAEKNKRYFDCVASDPEMPCFYFSDVFYPFFLIQDMVTGDSGRFNGSYIFSIIGGGPFNLQNIKYFTPEEILRYNTANGSETSSLIWLRADFENQRNPEGFHILSHAYSGIVWVCQYNSPCYDIIPDDMSAPDYYFVVKVSNRGVDQTTYCDYALEFIVHIHGLRLSATRSLYFLKISIAVVLALVLLYILIYTMGPKVRVFFNRTCRRLEEAFAFRAESSLTFSSSFTSQGSLQHLPSEFSHSSAPQSSSKANSTPLGAQ
ncbi:cation channel sperm-associated protein subunit gamma [Varanus komodoensis]|uniref:cation channel sperm-associated protein subunit gamma n=1 Tax=Varanus komodoensis TaxID=61221 RepID=UPI001CF7BEBC|nr:cation channel sperm-associated protein subunit gamma [Varanus komodoensis]